MDALIQTGKEVLHWLFRRWTGPRLEVVFDPLGEPHESVVVDADNQKGWFYRLRVNNLGRSTAEECQAFLSAAEPVQGGRALERPAVLKWAHEDDFRRVSIEPGEFRKLDLFFVLERDARMHFYIEMPQGPAGFDRAFQTAAYRVKVRVKAKTGAPAVASFRVEPGAEATTFRVFRE
jgi:hypothetical protein